MSYFCFLFTNTLFLDTQRRPLLGQQQAMMISKTKEFVVEGFTYVSVSKILSLVWLACLITQVESSCPAKFFYLSIFFINYVVHRGVYRAKIF